MTRINVGVEPSKLSRQHLLAEHREIKRIPNAVRTGKAKIENIPENFRLGKGHVKFFYIRLGYLLKRYRKIYKECINRGFQVSDYSKAWDGIPSNLMGDYHPTEKDRQIVKARIKERS